ncbi:MAG TPA: hypothetical protein VF533_13670 [Solirubrobacteraceae bacterium]|jgi:hypothetical protein
MRLYLVALLAVGASAGGALIGVLSSDPEGSEAPASVAATPAAAPAGTPQPPAVDDGDDAGSDRSAPRRPKPWIRPAVLRRRVEAAGHGARVGVFVRPLGAERGVGAGALQSGPAWSTAKVPVIVARLRLAGGQVEDGIDSLATRALTASDNEAAQELFDQISARQGGTEQASRYVTGVLRDAGDRVTAINSRRVRPEFSTFGQTAWSLAEGTRFFSALARQCVAPRAADRRVGELMTHVVASQRWGLGHAPTPASASVSFKGGWGPDPAGRYLVRQFGVVRTRDGAGVAVGMMAVAGDGGFSSGVAAVDRLARAVVSSVALGRLRPAAGCGRG